MSVNLVADVGGTQTRLALAADAGLRLERLQVTPTPADVAGLVRDYLRDAGAPALDCFACCGAGPVRPDGGIQLTNAPVLLDPMALQVASGARRVRLLNDFEAVAHAVPALGSDQLRQCGGLAAVPQAPRLVLGPGTGLGIAVLVEHGGGWQVLRGEGGHADLAPVDHDELGVWRALHVRGPRVSVETVLSGRGLERLYEALQPAYPQRAIDISQAAAAGDAMAAEAQRLFTRWLGRVAGNLALTLSTEGGVYIAGGIVAQWGTRFDGAEFRAGFEDKAPFREYLARIPAYLVTHPQPGLLGLARCAAGRVETGTGPTVI